MPRRPRVVEPGLAHHITQRGNNQQRIYDSDFDCGLFLEILGERASKYGLAIWGYCLMPNHFHLIGVPDARGRSGSHDLPPGSRLRALPEHAPRDERASVAGSLLFDSDGRAISMAGSGVCGAESCARGSGAPRDRVSLVERRCSLGDRSSTRLVGARRVATALVA